MKQIDRREFMKYAGLTSVGFVVGFQVPLAGRKAHAKSAFQHHYFVLGESEGDFTFILDKAEMGQGVITGLTTMFCEELEISPDKVKIQPAPVHPIYGTLGTLQVTGGSTSTPDRWGVLRQAGADLREAFLQAAEKKLGVPKKDLKAENGYVLMNDGSKSISYNALADLISLDSSEPAKLKSPKDYKYIGRWNQRLDALEKSTGQAKYGIDFEREGLLNAVILRSPTFGGKVKSFDAAEAKKLPGIQDVFEISRGVAIVGEKYWQVNKARELVKVEWEPGKNAKLSSKKIADGYRELLKSESGKEVHAEGDFEKAFEDPSVVKVEAEYNLPYLAHATLEPMNATAHVQDDRADIWLGSQGPTSVQNEAADFLGLGRDKVTVHNAKYLGGGFGRRSTVDYPMEAVELSQALGGRPVKVIWSREDDMRFSPMRPLSVHKLRASIKDSDVTGWEHKVGSESIMQGFLPGIVPHSLPGWIPQFLRRTAKSAVSGVLDLTNMHATTAEGAHHDYKIANQYVGIVSQEDLEIPLHFWRSVGHSHNGFVKESFADEVALAAKKDPFEFRMNLLSEQPRGKAVLAKVAEMASWGSKLPAGIHRGIAYHFSFGSWVAQVAEVSVKDQSIVIERVYCSVDCGQAINPDIVKDQMKSSIIFGLTAALKGEITLEEGSVQQSNFDSYPLIRMSESPDIAVEIIDSTESPMGVGEPGLPPIAAAVGNAIFQAIGQRLRSLPLRLS